MAVEYKTLYATLQAGSNTYTFTDNLISDVSKLTLMTDDDDVYPVNMEITNTHSVAVEISDHTAPVQIALIINNVETYSPVDISGIEDEIQSVSDNLSGLTSVVNEISDNVDNIEGDVSTLGTMVTDLETSKQDTLTAGENITIVDNVISSTGGGEAFIEMTKSEYDALPDTKLTDSVPRLITDYSEGSGSYADNNYSTEEQRIGTWLGKPLYRKVIQKPFGTYPNGNTVSIDVENYIPINCEAFRVTTDKNYIYKAPVDTGSGYYFNVQRFDINGVNYKSQGWNSGDLVLIVEYTKVGD